MEKKREEDIENLLTKMREENKQYQNIKSSSSSQNEEEEEDSIIESRYNEPQKTETKAKNKKPKVKKLEKEKNKLKKVKKSPSESKKKNLKKKIRPSTATVKLRSPDKTSKKDKLTVFLNWQEQWKSSEFLRTNPVGSREGRKLDLISRFKLKKFEIQKKTNTQSAKDEFIPPHEKRRDDLRFSTRMKMLSF